MVRCRQAASQTGPFLENHAQQLVSIDSYCATIRFQVLYVFLCCHDGVALSTANVLLIRRPDGREQNCERPFL